MTRLGLFVDEQTVVAAVVRRGRVRWSAVSPCSDARLPECVDALFASAPKRVRRMRHATVALGPGYAQVKRLEGVPPVSKAALLTTFVRENATAFFLRPAGGIAVSDVVRHGDGSVWAAAFDEAAVRAVTGALRGHGFTQLRVIPAADAKPCDAAMAAATAGRRATLQWRAEPDPARVRRMRRTGYTLLCVATALLVAAAIGGRGVRDYLYVRDASRELAAQRPTQTEMARLDGELNRATALLQRVRRFGAERGRVTLLLAALAREIPDSTALITLRLDSLEGSVTTITTQAADVLPQLTDIPGIVAPRIVGSITKETTAGAPLERATIRFRR